MPLHKAIFIEPGVSGAKYALSRLGKVGERGALAADDGRGSRPPRRSTRR